jgi:hypothetical protein
MAFRQPIAMEIVEADGKLDRLYKMVEDALAIVERPRMRDWEGAANSEASKGVETPRPQGFGRRKRRHLR